jgi:hypothetical protein
MERLFNLAEAEALLPRLGPMLERLQAAREQLRTGSRQAAGRTASNGSAGAALAGSRAENEFSAALQEIEGLGVVVRDPDTGLVDFAATRDGEPVYLCWRLGEPHIGFWHSRDTGFAGRQPI